MFSKKNVVYKKHSEVIHSAQKINIHDIINTVTNKGKQLDSHMDHKEQTLTCRWRKKKKK
jgi:hypothetical protein